MGPKELPDDKRESGEADTAERGSGCFERGSFAPAHGALKAGAVLLLFVFFDQRRAGGEDRRKSQKGAAYAGSPALSD
jgi:hypothetical protein